MTSHVDWNLLESTWNPSEKAVSDQKMWGSVIFWDPVIVDEKENSLHVPATQ
jgi:hypothetical protein